MKKCTLFFNLLIIIIITILFFALYNTIKHTINKDNTKEEFTPKMRETYRPYLRHARIVSEGFYGDSKNNITHLFRKFGLY